MCVYTRGEASYGANQTLLRHFPPFPRRLSPGAGTFCSCLGDAGWLPTGKRLVNRKCQLLLEICRSEWETAAERKGTRERIEGEGIEEMERKAYKKRCGVRQEQERRGQGWRGGLTAKDSKRLERTVGAC